MVLGRLVLTDGLAYLFCVFGFRREFQVGFELSHPFFALPSLEIDGAEEPVSVLDFVSSQLNRAGQLNFGFGKAAQVGQRLAKIEVAIC